MWLSRWAEGYMLLLTGYFDETGQERDDTQKVNGMAGFIAGADEWLSFEADWNAHIKHKQYKTYHNKDIRPKDRERRRRPLLDILESHAILPVCFIVSMDTLRAFPPIGQELFGDPYYRAYAIV